MIATFCPLLITYSNAVKQYSVEALAAVLLPLFFEQELRRASGPRAIRVLAAGALAPWISLSSAFVLATVWVVLALRAARLAAWSAAVWGMSGAIAYATVYRSADRSPYLQRFWELAFVTPARPEFVGRVEIAGRSGVGNRQHPDRARPLPRVAASWQRSRRARMRPGLPGA
jgi:hypothetical protein